MRRGGLVVGLITALGLVMPSVVLRATAGSAEIPPPKFAPGAAGVGFTPVTNQLIEPPSPFMGSDGKRHLAFELLLTNMSPRQASVTKITVRAGSASGTVLENLDQAGVMANMTAVGDLALTTTSTIPSYSTDQLVLDAVVPGGSPVPTRLSTTLMATFQAPLPGQPPYVSIFPDVVTENLPPVPVSTTKPLLIPSPLSGGDWMSTNSCCDLSPHRGAILGGGGLPASPERFAIDFIRIDGNGDLYRPDVPQSMTTNYSYGAQLLAVAPSTVVAIQDGMPDQPPGVNPTGYSLNQLGGNYVVLRLNAQVYALYGHLAPQSIKVQLGERLRTGQLVALLGNSGNSTAPHLHFQLMNGPGLLTSQGVPYEFRNFRVLALPNGQGTLTPVNPPMSVKDAYPLTNSVVGFPGGSSAPVSPSPEPPEGTGPGA